MCIFPPVVPLLAQSTCIEYLKTFTRYSMQITNVAFLAKHALDINLYKNIYCKPTHNSFKPNFILHQSNPIREINCMLMVSHNNCIKFI